jgi:hypothetical protein
MLCGITRCNRQLQDQHPSHGASYQTRTGDTIHARHNQRSYWQEKPERRAQEKTPEAQSWPRKRGPLSYVFSVHQQCPTSASTISVHKGI